MDLKIFIERAKRLCTETTPTILKADEPTGETPMELFITDEHTEYYLALSTATENDRGVLTGLLTLMSIPLFFHQSMVGAEWKMGKYCLADCLYFTRHSPYVHLGVNSKTPLTRFIQQTNPRSLLRQ